MAKTELFKIVFSIYPIVYAYNLIPNTRLALRLALGTFSGVVSLGQVVHQIRRNVVSNMFHERDCLSETIIPNAVYIEPSYDCNRRCRGCYAPRSKGMVESVIVEQAIEWSLGAGVNYVAWLGGEPLLPKTRDLVLSTTENFPRMSFIFCTNGDPVDSAVADRISRLDNLVPLISVDGFRETQDWRRGKDAFVNAKRAMQLLKERRRLFGYATTVMQQNATEVASPRFAEEMISAGCWIGSYSLYIPGDRGPPTLDSEEYRKFVSRLISIARDYPIYILSTDFGCVGRSIEKAAKRLIGISIDPFGRVRTDRGGKPIGDLHSESLEAIVLSETTQRIFKAKLDGKGNEGMDPRLKVLENMGR